MIQDIYIAITTNPDELSWDMLEAITADAEVLEKLIYALKDFELFSEEQEDEMKRFVKEAMYAGIITPKRFISERFINWTDITYALVKAYEPLFKRL